MQLKVIPNLTAWSEVLCFISEAVREVDIETRVGSGHVL